MGGNGTLTKALMLDNWLKEFTLWGAYPIPWRLHGREVLDRYARPGPVLYCWTHLPLMELPFRALLDLDYPRPAVVVSEGRLVEGNGVIVCGCEERLPAFPANFHALARVRSTLSRGTAVLCYADSDFGGELISNPMHLAGRLGVPVIFQWGELASDGVIDITFREAPHPFCESEEAIQENLRFLREANHRVLRSLGIAPPATDVGAFKNENAAP